MPAYYVTTQPSQIQAALVGSREIASYFDKQLSDNGVKSKYVKWKEYLLNSVDFNYYFFFVDLSKSSVKKIYQLSQLQFSPDTKLTIFITETADNNTKSSNLNKIQSSLGSLIQKNTNLRLVILRDLYGPKIKTPTTSFLGQLLNIQDNTEIWIKSNPNKIIYPLHIDDAVTGGIKATFTRNSLAKVYQLGGNPITVKQAADTIIEATPQTQLNYKFLDEENPELSNDLGPQVLQLTMQELGWKPKTSFVSGIKEIIQEKRIQTPPLPKITQELLHQPPPLILERPQLPHAPINKPSQISPYINTVDNVTDLEQPKSFILDTKTSNPANNPVQGETNTPRQKQFRIKVPSLRKRLVVGLSLVLLIIVFTLLIPVVSFGYQIWSVKREVKQLQAVISAREIESVSQEINQLYEHSQQLYQRLNIYYTPISWLLGKDRTDNILQLTQLLQYLTQAGKALSEAAETGNQVFSVVVGNEKDSIDVLLHTTEAKITEAYHYLSLAQSIIDNNPKLVDIKVFEIDQQLRFLHQQLPIARHLLSQLQQFLMASPEILGINGRRTYLVLLQNNMELRPTGGFIGSYATIVFENGKLLDYQVEDVYTADGQLRGYIEPPEPIQRYLGESTWFLRDSNWNPHFPTTAETAAWFIDKEMNISVNGVVGINLNVIQKFLEIMGPVELIDYDEIITAENVFERLQYQSEINFFPGSTQKKDYLSHVTRLLFQQVEQAQENTLFELARVLVDSANEKQITIALNDPQAQQVLQNLHWDGSIVKPECEFEATTDCVSDYFGIREANLGVNKANYFVDRTIKHLVSIRTNAIKHTVILSLFNDSTSNAWPGGTYRNYLRAYVTKGAILDKISLDNVNYDLTSVDESTESGKTVWGFITNTEPGRHKEIKIEYTVPQGLGETKLPGYQLYVQKQPGTGADPYAVTFTYENQYQIGEVSFDANTQVGQVSVSDQLNTDKTYKIEFVR